MKEGKEQRTPVWYSKGSYSKESGIPAETITIYARRYKPLPSELNPENDSDIQTDYFAEDRARITPQSKYYKAVLKAMKGKEESREKRHKKKEMNVQETDRVLMAKINKLAQKSEENTLLDFELSGYMKDKQRRDIFRNYAKHILQPRKKYISINQNTSGKFMVEVQGSNKGKVYQHKSYGSKGNYVGDIDKVISSIEKSNATMINRVMARARGKK